MSSLRAIHVWAGGLEETGGVQACTRACLEALSVLYPGRPLRVFAKNDTRPEGLPPGAFWHGFGKWRGAGRTLAFTASGLAWALRERPALVLAAHPHFMKALAPLARVGVPVVTLAHGVEVWGRVGGALGAALRSATGVLPVSAFTREVLAREGGVAESRMRVLPNTFREEMFSPGPAPEFLRVRHGLGPDARVIFTVGRLSAAERYKGQDQTLRALALLKAEMPELRYIIGGSGDDMPRLLGLAAELGVADRVIFTGFIPEEELAAYHRLADLYVMPGRGEGFGIVYLEALACGRPGVAGNLDASSEALDGGRLGFVVDPDSTESVAVAIRAFFSRAHAKPWLHEPETLHAEVVRLFGRQAFQKRLGGVLAELAGLQPQGGPN